MNEVLLYDFDIDDLVPGGEGNHRLLFWRLLLKYSIFRIVEFFSSMEHIDLRHLDSIDRLDRSFDVDLRRSWVDDTCIHTSEFSFGTFIRNDEFLDDAIER